MIPTMTMVMFPAGRPVDAGIPDQAFWSGQLFFTENKHLSVMQNEI